MEFLQPDVCDGPESVQRVSNVKQVHFADSVANVAVTIIQFSYDVRNMVYLRVLDTGAYVNPSAACVLSVIQATEQPRVYTFMYT